MLGLAAKEYGDVYWLGWAIIWALTALPFVWEKATDQPLWRHQVGNWVLNYFIGKTLSGSRGWLGDSGHVIAIASVTGFGIGYAILAIHRKRNWKGGIKAIIVHAFICFVLVNVEFCDFHPADH